MGRDTARLAVAHPLKNSQAPSNDGMRTTANSASFESDRSAAPFHAKLFELLFTDPQTHETQWIGTTEIDTSASQTLS